MHAKKLVFHKGVPLGFERKDNYQNWDAFNTRKLLTYSDLGERYSYMNLKKVFYWAKSFRAGVLIIHRDIDKKINDLLLVHQKEVEFINNAERYTIPERVGPPKGGYEPQYDITALDTAIREVREETGINILDPDIGAKLLPSTFIIRRPEKGIDELIIYFIAIVSCKPPVNICTKELSGYTWTNLNIGLKHIKNISIPTKLLLPQLENSNILQIGNINGLELHSE